MAVNDLWDTKTHIKYSIRREVGVSIPFDLRFTWRERKRFLQGVTAWKVWYLSVRTNKALLEREVR